MPAAPAENVLVVLQTDRLGDDGVRTLRRLLHEVRPIFLVLAVDLLPRRRFADGARIAQRDDELLLAGRPGELEELVCAQLAQL